MEEQELETLLHHLGQDIAYMGHCVQRDAQKLLKDLTATHDQNKFCNKLTGILKRFSEYTIQYSKDLEGRIKEYNKEEEYRGITKTLQEIATKTVSCHTCKTNEKLVESSSSLGFPSNNNADEESTNYLDNEVLSQCSLHIGDADEIKSEQLPQTLSQDIQNEDIPTSTTDHPNEERRRIQQEPDISSIHDDNDLRQEAENHRAGIFEDDTDIANSLEISHSEEIPSVEDEEEVTVCNSGGISVENPCISSVNHVAGRHDFDELPKLDVIALPYKPISEVQMPVEKSGDSDVVCLEDSISSNGAKSSSLKEDILNKENTSSTPNLLTNGNIKELHTDEIDDSYIEIVSVASSNEENDSDIEIIENILPSVINISDLACASNNTSQITEEKIDSDAETVKTTSPRAEVILEKMSQGQSIKEIVAHINESQNTEENRDSDTETVKNSSPRAAVVLETMSQGQSIEEIAAHINESQSTEANRDSDTETVKNSSPRAAVVLETMSQGQSIEEIAAHINESQSTEANRDSDTETVKNSSPRAAVVVETMSQGQPIEEIVAHINESQNTEENRDSDTETVKNSSPRAAVVLETMSQGQSIEEIVAHINESQNTEENRDSDTETVKNSSPRAAVVLETMSQGQSIEEIVAHINELQSTKANRDSDTETVKNSSPRAAVVLEKMSQGQSIEEIVAHINESQSTEDNLDSDTETVKNSSPRAGVVLEKMSQGQSIEEIVAHINESQSSEDNLDSDTETVKNSSPRAAVVLEKMFQGQSSEKIVAHVSESQSTEENLDSDAETVRNPSPPAAVVLGTLSQGHSSEEIVARTSTNESQSTNDLIVCSKDTEDSDNTIITSPLHEVAVLDREETPNVSQDSDSDDIYSKATQKSSSVAQKFTIDDYATTHLESSDKEGSNHSKVKDHRAIADIETQNGETVFSNGDSTDLTGEESGDSPEEEPEVATQAIEISQTKCVREGEDVVIEDCEVDMLSQSSYVFDLATGQDSEEIVQRQSPGNNGIAEVAIVDEEKEQNEILEKENSKVSSNEVVASDSTTPTVKGTGTSPDNKDENISECGGMNDDDNLSISELSKNGSSSSSDTLATTSPKTRTKLKEKDRKSLLKVIAEYFLKRTREKSGISNENENDNKGNTKKELKMKTKDRIKDGIKSSKGSANNKDSQDLDDEDPDMTQKVYDIRKLKEVCSEEANDDIFDQATQNAGSKNSTEHSPSNNEIRNESQNEEVVSPFRRKTVRPLPTTQSDGEEAINNGTEPEESDQVVSPFKKKGVKRLHSSDESDSEPPKKISEIDESDILDDETIKPFKRKRINKLQSTDGDESVASKKTSEEESDIERGRKRKRVSRLISSGQDSPHELVMDQNDGQELVAENDRDNQFKLDDKARDDFLDLFDEPAEDPKSSTSKILEEQIHETDRHGDSDNECGGMSAEASQFRLSDCDRDNLLNLLTDKENDERLRDKDQREPCHLNLMNRELQDVLTGSSSSSENNSATNEPLNTMHTEDSEEDSHDGVANVRSQFQLDSKARDEFLHLLNGDSPSPLEHMQDENKEKEEKGNSNEEKTTNDGNSNKAGGKCIDPNQFQLTSADRDELLELLTNERSDESPAQEHKQVKSSEQNRRASLSATDIHITERGNSDSDEIEPSQFKLNDKARDDFLDLLNGDRSDDSSDKFEEKEPPSADNDNTDRPKVTSDSNTSSKENNDKNTLNSEDVDLKDNGDEKDRGEAMDVGDENDIDDAATENSQGIDDFDESEEDANERIDDRDDEINDENTSAEFKLDENERNELLILLSDHINKREMDSSESDCDNVTDTDNENGIQKKNKRKSKKVDRNMLLELLQEYENAVTKKGKALVENIKNGDLEFANMDSKSEKANSDFGEDSAADSESVLLDLLREETVEEPVEGQRRKKVRNNGKEAWNAYRQLLKDSEELSDTSLELSDIDIEDFELDLSDQERKHKERELHENLRNKFNIEKELVVNLEQADITQFDISLLPRRGQNSSRIDRLCDISSVLQKRRKKVERKTRKVKVKRLSSSVSSSETENSDSDDSRSSTSTQWSYNSLRANQDSASARDSPILHLSDDNAEQEKLANTLWENIKNSSDENSAWSSDSTTSDDKDKKKKGKGGGGGGKKGKEKKGSDDEDENGTEDDTSSEKSGSDDGDGNNDETGADGAKDADLDSSDEEDFVGVRKSRGAWKRDPLLKSCFTSDEESDSDASPKKARSRIRNIKRTKRKDAGGGNDGLDAENDGTPTEENENSTDSDVEFIMEKQKTPKKIVEIDDEVEDDSPSKRGAGRRNIRALFEDDELAEATKKAKKEETERIKRLQERERAKETFTQSQSFGSQLSEDLSDPLILDVNEELQIKVHPKITTKLKPHQRIGIQFMWDSCYESLEQLKKGYEGSGCILAHCMGLGKTLQALGLIHTLFNHQEITKTKHVLVVCPLSTVSNWRNEFRLAYKDIKQCNVNLYTIQDKKVANQRCKIVGDWWRTGGVLVMGYECFGIMINDQKWEKWDKKIGHEKKDVLKALVSPGPDLVICDEGHLLRNKQTQRSLALNKIQTRRRIVLTGTPLQNNLLEYYYMVNFVKPNLLGTEKEFKTNFINPISNGQFENSTAIDILFMKKRTHVLHKILNKTVQRVEDTELKKYLPELVDQALFVKLSNLQIWFYNTFLDFANSRPVEYTAAGNISRKNFLGDIQMLRYICTHPDVVTIAKRSVKSKIREQDVIDDILEDDGIDAKVFSRGNWYKDLVPENGVKKLDLGTKMTVTLGIVKEAITNDEKVLIFSQTHAEMDSLEFFLKQELDYKKGVDYNRMDGTISPEVRTHMCDAFNKKNNKRLRVFIMSTKVGGLGLNLTAASRVILMNVNWNPSSDTQSVFRAFRFGQNKAVYVYRLIALDTMEEKMYQRQVTKLAVAHRVVDKHQITRHYTEADIQEFYSARPRVEGERPLPNVPEDIVLAKLIQKFQFVYRWHEHQALLANRPEEDLNEHQKNAAWEEFNRNAVEPPPPCPPPLHQPQFLGNLLNQPGPSGLQNVNMAPGYLPPLPRPTRTRVRRSPRINKVPDPLQAMSNYVPTTLPVLIKQTESGPKLVIQTHGRIPGKVIPLRLGYSTTVTTAGRPSMTVSVIDTQSATVNLSRDEEAARKIREINSLVSAQTTPEPELVPGFNTTTTNSFLTSTADVHSSRIDEINSLTNAILSQHDNVSASSQEWAEDGMNTTLLNLNLPDDDREGVNLVRTKERRS